MASQQQSEDGRSLLVSSLPLDVSQDDLRTVFGTYGEVTSIDMMDADAGTNLRSAFVAYSRKESAADAIEVLHGIYKIRVDAELPISVEWASGRTAHRGGNAGADDVSQPLPFDHCQRQKRQRSEDGRNSYQDSPARAHTEGGSSQKAARTGPMITGSGADAKMLDVDGYKIFVGGLPNECTEEELRQVFKTYGQVNKVHIMPPHQQTGRVAAFVFYENAETGDDAISVLNRQYKIRRDAELPIEVKWAMPKDKSGGANNRGGGGFHGGGGGSWGGAGGSSWKDDRGGGDSWGGGRSSSGGGGMEASTASSAQTPDGWKLYVGGLPGDITDAELLAVFSTYGQVRKVYTMQPHPVHGGVAAFVFYANEQAGTDAIQVLHDQYKIRVHADAPIQVRWAQPSIKSGDRGRDARRGSTGGNDQGWKKNWSNQDDNNWSSQGWNSSWKSARGGGGWHDNSSDWRAGNDAGGANDWNQDDKVFSDTKLFVGNLPVDVSEEALRYVFGTYGKVANIRLMGGGARNGSVCAFVEFNVKEDADTAVRTLHEVYEMKPGTGKIIVKKANNTSSTSRPQRAQ